MMPRFFLMITCPPFSLIYTKSSSEHKSNGTIFWAYFQKSLINNPTNLDKKIPQVLSFNYPH